MLIHILDDNSHLNIFYFCRPDENETDVARILEGGVWDREHWWYKLARDCPRWRRLILALATHLGLSLLCTYGTPVGTFSPSSVYHDYLELEIARDVTGDDDGGINFALRRPLTSARSTNFPYIEGSIFCGGTPH